MKETITVQDVLSSFVLSQQLQGIEMKLDENSGRFEKKEHTFVYLTNTNPKDSDLETIICTCIDGKVDMEITFYGVNNKLYKFLKECNAGRKGFLNKSFKNMDQFQRFFLTMQTQSAKPLMYKPV